MVRIAVILTALLAACSGAEHIEARYDGDAGLRYEGCISHAGEQPVAEGPWTFLFASGGVQAEGEYLNGGLPGEADLLLDRTVVPSSGRTEWWSFWDEEGRLVAEGNYADGLRDDLWVTWYENGSQCCSGKFAAGLEHGYHVHWDPEGRKRDTCTYVEGRLWGPRRVLDENGRVVWAGEYEAGELISSDPPEAPEPQVHGLPACLAGVELGMAAPLDFAPGELAEGLGQ